MARIYPQVVAVLELLALKQVLEATVVVVVAVAEVVIVYTLREVTAVTVVLVVAVAVAVAVIPLLLTQTMDEAEMAVLAVFMEEAAAGPLLILHHTQVIMDTAALVAHMEAQEEMENIIALRQLAIQVRLVRIL